jgi:hypothetical protein
MSNERISFKHFIYPIRSSGIFDLHSKSAVANIQGFGLQLDIFHFSASAYNVCARLYTGWLCGLLVSIANALNS